MGEEKPDEELMGKRKSSPRLSTTLVMSIIIEWPISFLFIHVKLKKMSFDVVSVILDGQVCRILRGRPIICLYRYFF